MNLEITKFLHRLYEENEAGDIKLENSNDIGLYFKNLVNKKDYFYKLKKEEYEYYFDIFEVFFLLIENKEIKKEIFGTKTKKEIEEEDKEAREKNLEMLAYLEEIQNNDENKDLTNSPLRLQISFGNLSHHISLVFNEDEIMLKLRIFDEIQYITVEDSQKIEKMWEEMCETIVTYL